MKDVLWFMNFDVWPFRRGEGEKRIDFTVKMMFYVMIWTGAVVFDWWAILIAYGSYGIIARLKK